MTAQVPAARAFSGLHMGPIMLTAKVLGRFDSRELYTQAACYPENARKSIRKMRRAGMIHVAEWRRDHRGVMVAVYQWGAGQDARKPPVLSKRVRDRRCARRFRAGLVDKFGLEVARKIYKSRNSGGADCVVIDGITVYRRGPVGSKGNVA